MIGVLGPRITLAEQGSHDCHKNRCDHDLGGEGEPKTPPSGRPNQAASRTTYDAEQDRHEATDGLHAGHKDASDEADDDAGPQAGQDAVDFHGAIKPLHGRFLAFSG